MNTQTISGRYLLNEPLGTGGMGVVYRAWDRLTEQDVALKRVTSAGERWLFASFSSDGDSRVALAREFQFLASLRHPHIISVLDYGFDDERQPYFTMPLLANAPDILTASTHAPNGQFAGYAVQILQALIYLHQRGIIHRDLKPANILVQPDGTVKLLDFGLAAYSEEANAAAGTLNYLAPEIMLGERASVESDLYAVGLIVYEMFMGQHPFAGRTLDETLRRMQNETPNLNGIPIALHPFLRKLLARDPTGRYSSAAQALAALRIALDDTSPFEDRNALASGLQTAPFVGRERELERLREALDRMLDGCGGLWLIGGESGVGKSRFVNELRIRALVRGALVLTGQEVVSGREPFQLWKETIRRLALLVPLTEFEVAELSQIVPDLPTLSGITPAPASSLDADRIAHLIADLVARCPLPSVLILEDLQWSEESFAPLRILIDRLPTLPLLIIATYRDDERTALPRQLPGAKVIRLERLAPPDIIRLSQTMMGSVGARPEVVDLLQRETEGNVFFLVETVRALAEMSGGLREIGEVTLPRSIFAGGMRTIIERRLEKMPMEYRPLLWQAAVYGRALDVVLLRALNARAARPVNFDVWLSAGLDTAIFEIADGVPRFAHDKLREASIECIPKTERAEVHRQVAFMLETLHRDSRPDAEAVLHHWSQAGNAERELFYIPIVAAQQIELSGRYHEAREILQRGLRLLDIHPDPLKQRAILRLLGQAAFQLGEYRDAQKHRVAYLEAAETQHNRSAEADARLALGETYAMLGSLERAVWYIRESLDLSEMLADLPLIAAANASLGVMYTQMGRYVVAAIHHRRALDLRRAHGDKRLVADSLQAFGYNSILQGDDETAWEHNAEALALCEALGDRNGQAHALANLGSVFMFRGDYETANSFFKRSMTLNDASGSWRGLCDDLNSFGYLAELRGNFDEAHSYYLRSIAISRRIDAHWIYGITLNNLAFVAMQQTDYMAAKGYLSEALTTAFRQDERTIVMDALVGFARLSFQLNKFLDAAILLEFVRSRPEIAAATLLFRIKPLFREIEAVLPPEKLVSAQARSTTLELDRVVQRLLSEDDD